MRFQAETQKILHLVTHSLYTHRDIFLRELISNASDALDKLRFESLTQHELLETDPEKQKNPLEIHIEIDSTNKILLIRDNGIGMSQEEIIENLGTIARSGTEKFVESIKQNQQNQANSPDMIGQFGVGFYSVFMVARNVIVQTKKSLLQLAEPQAVLWQCEGEEEFQVEPIQKESRGTEVLLYLKEDALEYLQEEKIREIVRRYSDYIEFPIFLHTQESKEAQKLNSQKALWLKNKNELSKTEYEEFYKHLSHDMDTPLSEIHYKAEGTLEFSALLYIPQSTMIPIFSDQKPKNNLHLYIRKVLILKDSDVLLPEYLHFVVGVVDSSDLPLNISRETLQDNRIVQSIRKNLSQKVISKLLEIKEKELDRYKKFYQFFGHFLKEGVYSDEENREKLLELLLFPSTKCTGNERVSLSHYIERMDKNQKDIYFLTAENQKEAEHSLHLEKFKEKGYEVLYFLSPIDEVLSQLRIQYKGKEFQSVTKGKLEFGEKKELEKVQEQFHSFNEWLLKNLSEWIKEVRISERLTQSVCCLVGEKEDMSLQMEALLRSYQKEVPINKRILEINTQHPLIQKMLKTFEQNPEDSWLKDYSEILYNQALISEGTKIPNPTRFNQKLSEWMLKL